MSYLYCGAVVNLSKRLKAQSNSGHLETHLAQCETMTAYTGKRFLVTKKKDKSITTKWQCATVRVTYWGFVPVIRRSWGLKMRCELIVWDGMSNRWLLTFQILEIFVFCKSQTKENAQYKRKTTTQYSYKILLCKFVLLLYLLFLVVLEYFCGINNTIN